MKYTLVLVLALTTAVLTAVCLMQSHKSATQQVQAAALRGELEVKSQQMETVQAAQQAAERRRQQLAAQAEALAAQLQARQAAATNAAPATAPTNPSAVAGTAKPDDEKGGFGKMISKMMDNPETRQLMRNQQRMMIDQSYASLIKQMGLTPEEADKFKGMLADHAMKGAEKAFAAMNSAGSANSADAFKGLSAQQGSFDEEVRAFLGDDHYSQYKSYQETLPDRMMLNQFKLQAGTDYNLTDPQSEALLKFMAEERKSVAATTGLPLTEGSKDPAAFQALMSGEKVDEFIRAQETVGQRVYERARTILSPEQLQTLGRFQTNQIQMTRVGLSMMRTMLAPRGPGSATPQSQ
jgi:hypothetical protein